MNRPRSSSDDFPLFGGDPDVWESLGEPAKQQVLDHLAVLLLRHLQHTAAYALKKTPSQKEPMDER